MSEDEPPSFVVWYVLGAVLAFVLIVGVRNVYIKFMRRRLQQRECPNAQPIHVLVVIDHDNYAAAGTLKSMMTAATCPSRLRFYLHQNVSQKSKDVFDLYTAMAVGDEMRIRQKDVHVVTSSQNHPSYAQALQRLLELAPPTTSTALLLTTPGTIFADNFDRALEEAFSQNIALTCHGPKYQTSTHPPSSSQDPLVYFANTFPTPCPSIGEYISFPCLRQTTAQSVPHLYGRTSKSPRPVPVIACSPLCTFFRRPKGRRGRHTLQNMDNEGLVLSDYLFQHGIAMMSPPFTVCFERSTPRPRRKLSPSSAPPSAAYLEFAGMDDAWTLYGRGFLGLTPTAFNYPQQEIIDKFGSRNAMERAKREQRV
jgi:hypothetical protein